MKKEFVRATRLFTFLLGAVLLVLALLSGFLYTRSKNFESANRKLIIQNDSIMSVNIELKNALQQKSSVLNSISNRTY